MILTRVVAGFLSALISGAALADASEVTPEAVERALRFAMECSGDTPPRHLDLKGLKPTIRISKGLQRLSWSELPDVTVTVEESTGDIVALENNIPDKSNKESSEADEPLQVTEAQAIEKCQRAVKAANIGTDRWLVMERELTSNKIGSIAFRKDWCLSLFREVNGLLADQDRAYIQIDPFSGAVTRYHQSRKAYRLPVDGPIIDSAVALRTATEAFHSSTRDSVRSDAICTSYQILPGVAYKSIANDHGPSRLAYTYYFKVRQRDVQSDPLSERQSGYEAVVDAVTGEVWWVKFVAGWGESVKTNPNLRFAAAAKLAADTRERKLIEVLLMSKPVKTKATGNLVGKISGDYEIRYYSDGVLSVSGVGGVQCLEVPLDRRDDCYIRFSDE